MNVVGAIIFWIAGILSTILVSKAFKKKNQNYLQYPVAVGEVIGTEDYCGERWLVTFDLEGEKVLAMDDSLAASTFKPEKYHLPKRGTQENIYYWKYTEPSSYGLNGKKVEYYFHFCDESLYELRDFVNHRAVVVGRIFGVVFALLGLLILLKG